MKKTLLTFAAVYAIVLGATSCSGGGGNQNAPGVQPPAPAAPINTAGYVQIERLARPAIKEATENFANHDTTNRVSPESSTTDSVLFNSIATFDTTVAGRTAAHAGVLQSVLIPDEMVADLSKTDAGGYFGADFGLAGKTFGGRLLTDDVIDTDLAAVFGTLTDSLGATNGTPGNTTPPYSGKPALCLSTDNVGPSVQVTGNDGISTTFPYVGAPH